MAATWFKRSSAQEPSILELKNKVTAELFLDSEHTLLGQLENDSEGTVEKGTTALSAVMCALKVATESIITGRFEAKHARFCSDVVVQVALVLKWHEVGSGGSNRTERAQGNRFSTKLRKGLGTEITTELGPKLLNPHCEFRWVSLSVAKKMRYNFRLFQQKMQTSADSRRRKNPTQECSLQ